MRHQHWLLCNWERKITALSPTGHGVLGLGGQEIFIHTAEGKVGLAVLPCPKQFLSYVLITSNLLSAPWEVSDLSDLFMNMEV